MSLVSISILPAHRFNNNCMTTVHSRSQLILLQVLHYTIIISYDTIPNVHCTNTNCKVAGSNLTIEELTLVVVVGEIDEAIAIVTTSVKHKMIYNNK